MKENTEKRQFVGWLRITECLRDTLIGHPQQEVGGLGHIFNSAMNSFYVFGRIISFSQTSVFL